MKEQLADSRRTSWIGKEIFYASVLDSTNTKAKQLAEQAYPAGTVVIAERQEAGRGRTGRSWDSPAGEGIFMTLLLRPAVKPDCASMLTLVAALAVTAAIRKCTGKNVGIKWPNDIVMNGKKVCGILTEMAVKENAIDYVVVGIGINVLNVSFSKELAQLATSLYLETGEYFERAVLIEEVWEQFEYYYEQFLKTMDLSRLAEEYEAQLVNKDQRVRVLDPKEPFEGNAVGITERGELLVDTGEGRKIVASGEVSVRGIYGYV